MRCLGFILAVLVLMLGIQVRAQGVYGVNDSIARARAIEYYYLQARSYMEQDSLDRSYEMLEHCYALDPSSLAVMFDLSAFNAALGKDSIATAMLEHIVEADPSNVFYNRMLVKSYFRAGNVQAAIDVFENLLASGYSKNDIYSDLYTLYSQNGDHLKAIGMLDKIEKLEGASEGITLNKVTEYMALGDSTNAVNVIVATIKENPDDLRFMTLLGNTYYSLGDRVRALEAYGKVLEAKPDDSYALSSLAALYADDEDDSLYCMTVERLLKNENIDSELRVNGLVQYVRYKHPTDSARVAGFMREVYALPFDEYAIAGVYNEYLKFVNASPDSIVPVLERMHAMEPENPNTIVALLSYAVEGNDTDAVYRYADGALPYLPDVLELYYYKGLASYLLGKKEECIGVYRTGLEKRSANASPDIVSTVYMLLGDVYHEMDLIEECMQAYDSALVYNSNVSVLNNYAYYLALEGKELQRALDMSHKTILAEPSNTTYIDTYAWVLFCLGRYEEAKAYAEKLISSGEELNAEVYHHCGDIYAKCGDMDSAVKYWIMARDAGAASKILDKKIKKRKYYRNAKHKK